MTVFQKKDILREDIVNLPTRSISSMPKMFHSNASNVKSNDSGTDSSIIKFNAMNYSQAKKTPKYKASKSINMLYHSPAKKLKSSINFLEKNKKILSPKRDQA